MVIQTEPTHFIEPSDEKPHIFILYAIDGTVLGSHPIIIPAHVFNFGWVSDNILLSFLRCIEKQRLMLNTGVKRCAAISTVLKVDSDVPLLTCILIHNVWILTQELNKAFP